MKASVTERLTGSKWGSMKDQATVVQTESSMDHHWVGMSAVSMGDESESRRGCETASLTAGTRVALMAEPKANL